MSFYLHRTDVVFLMYHGVIRDDEELESTTIVRESEFRRQLKYLKENYECLSIDEALNNCNGRKKPGVVVTFDDGYANNYTVALPLLDEFRIPAIVYVTTRNMCERTLLWSDRVWVAVKRSRVSEIDLTGISRSLKFYRLHGSGDEWQYRVHLLTEDIKRAEPSKREQIVNAVIARLHAASGSSFEIDIENTIFTPLTPLQLKELSSHPLITIGAHSHCHNLLNQIPLAQAKESIIQSKKILKEIIGQKIKHFSYPNGNLTPEIVQVLKDTGFMSAVTVPPGFFRPGNDQYRIPRVMVGAYMSLELFKAKLTGIFELAKMVGL
jgi:peptidoglycan/xylan/chitin deacetylase (PgdA/CDA1 family)